MSKARLMLGMAAMMSALAYGGISGTTPDFREPKETEEDRKKRLAKAELENNKRKGLKEFFYENHSVWAINKKVADKKALKKGYILNELIR